MSFDPFDSQLYTQPIEQPVVETEVEPLQETSSREYNTMLEPEPTDIEDILDHYKNLKLTDDEIDELRKGGICSECKRPFDTDPEHVKILEDTINNKNKKIEEISRTSKSIYCNYCRCY